MGNRHLMQTQRSKNLIIKRVEEAICSCVYMRDVTLERQHSRPSATRGGVDTGRRYFSNMLTVENRDDPVLVLYGQLFDHGFYLIVLSNNKEN